MRKGFKYYFAAWIVMMIVFNSVLVIITSNTVGLSNVKGMFWFVMALINLSMIAQLLCVKSAFSGDAEKLFLNLPLIRVTITGSIVIFIVGLVFLLISVIPLWVTAVVCIIIVGINVYAVIRAKAAADLVHDKDVQLKQKMSFIKNITVDAQILVNSAASDDEKKQLTRVYEALRYSDPLSSPELQSIEEDIQYSFNSLKREYSEEKVNSLLNLINARNIKCKNLK